MSDWSDIGAALRSTRETLGSSLQDVSHRTRIPIQTLHQLEENDYSGFPSPAYAKSFLSQYSQHLGLDAADWLENFDTGDVFANLDSYEYLKDHDERLGPDAPVKTKPKRAKKKAAAAAPPAPAPVSVAVLQPLVVFTLTAVMITGAVFGFLHLSKNLAENTDASLNASATPKLKPVSSIPESQMADQNFANAPRAVAVPTSSTSTPLVSAAEPVESRPSAPREQTPIIAEPNPANQLVGDAPPSRAIIVEE